MRLIIRNGRVLCGEPAQEKECDLVVEDGFFSSFDHVAAKPEDKVINAENKLLLPGLVDLHTHYINRDATGFFMLTAAGVTTALDALVGSGKIASEYINRHASGLNAGCMYVLKPGLTVADNDPRQAELEKVFDDAVKQKVFGIKIVGAHYPLTPDAAALAIRIAAERGIPLLFHAGTTENRDDLNGMKEAVSLADNNPFMLAHVNIYCNGKVTGDERAEALEAVRLLNGHPEIISESSLSELSCIGTKMKNGIPESLCMIDLLHGLGFAGTYDGMLQAIDAGKLRVSGPQGNVFDFLDREAGLARCRELGGAVTVGYAGHDVVKNLIVASGKRNNGEFTVNTFSTDGGLVPRNVTLTRALAAVDSGIFSLADFVQKSSRAGAKILGLDNKGVIAPGFDADMIIANPLTRKVETVISGGKITYHQGIFFPVPNKQFSWNAKTVIK